MKAILEMVMPENCMQCELHMRGICVKTSKDMLDYTDSRREDCPLKPQQAQIQQLQAKVEAAREALSPLVKLATLVANEKSRKGEGKGAITAIQWAQKGRQVLEAIKE
jgi:hypothetical protein